MPRKPSLVTKGITSSERSSRVLFKLALLGLPGMLACSDGHAREAEPTRTTAAPAARADDPPPLPSVEAAPPPAATGDTVPAKVEIPVAKRGGDRMYSKARFAWIQPAPRASKGWLGYLGLGGSIAVRGGSLEKALVPNAGSGSCKAWYAVEPRGYVCAGNAATVDPADPIVVELAADAPRTDSPWPYDYAESLGAPRFAHAPSLQEQQHEEWDFEDHKRLVERARGGEEVAKLAGVDLSPAAPGRWGAPPAVLSLHEQSPLVREARKWIATGSTVATTRSFELGGRTFVVTHDHALVPKDRIKPYPKSAFHGVELGADVRLPIAFFRKQERPKYKRGADGAFAPAGEMWPRLAWVALTGDEVRDGSRHFLATSEPGVWLLESEAAVVRVAEVPSVVARMSSGRKTWLDISVLGGTLVAYEDDKPVFATLISPGRGGVPAPGKDPLDTASTPVGTFRVDGKFVTATMVSSTNDLLVHTEVQYVQNFHGPHALHGAYWHDAWGQPKSGGCVNLSPMDAQRMFAWSEPPVPEDWYGMRSVPEMGPATVVVVHK